MVQTLMYGIPSGCSFGSIVALEWLGEPYRLCRIEMPAVVQSDAYREINPVGETPTLVTATGDPISESMAILNHLGARGIGKDCPSRKARRVRSPQPDAGVPQHELLHCLRPPLVCS